jgi:trans-aconitate 2-methyltransferase
MTTTWDPQQYALYSDERSRPFFELLARVPEGDYRSIVDLGCGPGTLTMSLTQRWPQARVLGVDSSPQMLTEAAAVAIPGRLDFRLEDIAAFDEEQDLLYSNAALQWLGEHESLLTRLAGLVNPRGCLAVQMPSNFYARSHALLTETATDGPWAAKLAKGWRPLSVHDLDWYVRLLLSLGFRVDAWETEYHFVLQGDDPVLEWVKGTALRPVLALLDSDQAKSFTGEYARRLREAYPKEAHGTVFPFKRIFMVAKRP